jgi:hypothetical protein
MASADDYRRVDLGRSQPAEDGAGKETFGPYPGPEMVPEPARSDAQFTSDTLGDPRDLARESDESRSFESANTRRWG